MRTTIRDPRIVACDDMWELEMSVQAIEEQIDNDFTRLETSLGILWTDTDAKQVDEVKSAADAKSQGMDHTKLRVPLTLQLRPEIIKYVKDHFASKNAKMPGIPTDAESMYKMPKEKFLEMFGQITGPAKTTGWKRDKSGQQGFQRAEGGKR